MVLSSVLWMVIGVDRDKRKKKGGKRKKVQSAQSHRFGSKNVRTHTHTHTHTQTTITNFGDQ